MRSASGILVLLLLAGCATGGDRPSRGKASEVAARAADEGTTGRGEGRTRTKTDHQDAAADPLIETWIEEEETEDDTSFLLNLVAGLFSGGDDEGSSRQIHDEAASSSQPTKVDRPNVQAGYSRGHPAGDAIGSLSTLSLHYSFYKAKRTRLFLGLYGGAGTKGAQPLIQEGIDRLWELGVDLGARSYLTPRHTLTGVYVLYGLRLGGLTWHYADRETQPVAGSDWPADDSVVVFTPYLGVGCSVLQVRALHLGASVSYGARISAERTFEEFDNDLFPTVEELRWTFDLSVFF